MVLSCIELYCGIGIWYWKVIMSGIVLLRSGIGK